MTKPETIFCASVYSSVPVTVLAHLLTVLSLCLCLWLMVRLHNKRHLFPIRQRCPSITLFQTGAILLQLLVLYGVEVLTSLDQLDWGGVTSASEVPTSRKIIKAIWLGIRINVYFIFAIR